jgi:hypothetical protein
LKNNLFNIVRKGSDAKGNMEVPEELKNAKQFVEVTTGEILFIMENGELYYSKERNG